MKKATVILLLFLCVNLAAAPKGKTPLRAGTYDVSNSFNRRVQAEKGKMSEQRMWCYSSIAIADAIIEADCDILGIQDVCDSIAGRREGAVHLIDIIKERGGDYDWLVLSNANPNFPIEGPLANGTGIIWRASRFELKDWGIQWLSGIYDKPGRAKNLKYGGNNSSFMWVKLYDSQAGKELVFVSASPSGPTQYDKGEKVVYHEINIANCTNLLLQLQADVVSKGMPSIIAINAHNAPSHDGYKALTGGRWLDVHDRLHEEGSLSEEAAGVKDCCNTPDEKKLSGGRPDHILVDGLDIVDYKVLRKKYPTADGTLHYPSLHFPVVAELQY